MGHDQRTAVICEAESFIARFTRIAQATFAKRVTTAFVGLRLGMGPGIAALLLFFGHIKRHSPLFKNTNARTDTVMHTHDLHRTAPTPNLVGLKFFFSAQAVKKIIA